MSKYYRPCKINMQDNKQCIDCKEFNNCFVVEFLGGKEMDDETLEQVIENDACSPQHYKNGTFEVLDEMLIVFGVKAVFDFCRLNAWKYRARADYKGKKEEDKEKADTYLRYAYNLIRNYPNENLGGNELLFRI